MKHLKTQTRVPAMADDKGVLVQCTPLKQFLGKCSPFT
jgi:hypothetical protein